MTKEEIEKAKYYELHKHYELVNLLMEKDKEIERLKNKAKSWEDLHGDVMESLRELTDIAVKTESELTELKEKHKDDAIDFHLWTQRGECDWVLNDEDDWRHVAYPSRKMSTLGLYNLYKQTHEND